MRLIKLLHKLLALPIIVAVTLIQWVGIFLTQFSTIVFNLLAGLIFLIAVCSSALLPIYLPSSSAIILSISSRKICSLATISAISALSFTMSIFSLVSSASI